MSQAAINARFFDSTRGKIVALLRHAPRTVDELAAELGVTDNAIRLHLGVLERDAIVRSQGVRREGAVGKPAVIYEIDPGADSVFSSAYLPFLQTLLTTLGDRLTSAELRALMRDVGRRLAADARLGGSLAARAEFASEALNRLGGLTVVEPTDTSKSLSVRGIGCPLAAAVERRDEVCLAVQTMLAEMTGTEVRETCDRSGARPHCCFRLTA